MLIRCHEHQHPEEYGRPGIEPPDPYLIPVRVDPYTSGLILPEEPMGDPESLLTVDIIE